MKTPHIKNMYHPTNNRLLNIVPFLFHHISTFIIAPMNHQLNDMIMIKTFSTIDQPINHHHHQLLNMKRIFTVYDSPSINHHFIDYMTIYLLSTIFLQLLTITMAINHHTIPVILSCRARTCTSTSEPGRDPLQRQLKQCPKGAARGRSNAEG